jgi:hypothetical protein
VSEAASDPFRARWYYAGYEDAENWWIGGETREEAIAAGRQEYPEDSFWITCGSPMKHNLDVFYDDVHAVKCAFQNLNEDMFGEDDQGDPEAEWTQTQERDLARRLNETFAAWARENGHEKAYMLDLTPSEEIPALEEARP